ncbi:MAG TPA: hypothetical protein ENN69_04355 [Spirochaetia bacterium]|nr:hypothetical protein [Spirochaetia bacterium]
MKKLISYQLVTLLLSLTIAGCAPLSKNSGPPVDCTPPVLNGAAAAGETRLAFDFSEPVVMDPDSFSSEPLLTVEAAETEESRLVLTVSPMAVGREYRCRLTVRDQAGNSTWLVTSVYGYNPRVPGVLLNEFITQGSSTHPDLVELKVLTRGNLGGLTFYHGTPDRFRYRFTFPALEVAAGDFILLHLKPEGLPTEINETAEKDASGGLDSSPVAYDFWVPDGDGLSGNNGVIVLTVQPGGKVLDAVLYSTRTSESDEQYRGFGSYDLLLQAETLAAQGAWQIELELVRPEDAVNPDDSTATRSICRMPDAPDTNTKDDFHIVPTRGSTFGTQNSVEVYIP